MPLTSISMVIKASIPAFKSMADALRAVGAALRAQPFHGKEVHRRLRRERRARRRHLAALLRRQRRDRRTAKGVSPCVISGTSFGAPLTSSHPDRPTPQVPGSCRA